ncbi:MAG TPA: hypothetical protein VM580_16930, partial [Labilithrix sp.]|nr:hypothetical protein [Labilithrix sp.]
MKEAGPLRYFVEVAKRRYEVREIEGHETIAKPFRLEVRFPVTDVVRFSDVMNPPLDPDQIIK